MTSEHILATDTGPLAYYRLGDGLPRVAMLPGWGLNVPFLRQTALWPVWEEWATARPLLFVDRRGTGGSRANTGDPVPEQFAADVVAALDDAGATAVAVWAQGEAVLAALTLAVRHATRVERLVLQAPFARLLAAPGTIGGMDLRAMMALAALDPSAPVLDELASLGLAAEAGDAVAVLRDTLSAGLLPRLLNDVASVDVAAVLPAVRVPVLVLHGAEDRVIPPAAGAAAARLLPDARLEPVPDMGHLPTPAQLRDLLVRVDASLIGGETD